MPVCGKMLNFPGEGHKIGVAGKQGFELRFHDPESYVLSIGSNEPIKKCDGFSISYQAGRPKRIRYILSWLNVSFCLLDRPGMILFHDFFSSFKNLYYLPHHLPCSFSLIRVSHFPHGLFFARFYQLKSRRFLVCSSARRPPNAQAQAV